MNDEWQRPPEQITSIEVVAVTKVGEDPKHADFWSVTQPKFEAIQAPVELQEHSQPSINAAQVMRGSDQGPGPQFLPIDQIGITVPEAASAWDHEIRIGNRDEVLISTAPFGAQRLRAALTTAALLVALGLGWIGGSNSYRFLGPNPASTPVKPKLTSSAGILRSDNETICSTPDTARQAAPGAPNTRKVATPTATRLGRGHESSQGSAQLDSASTNTVSSVAQQNTTSPGPAAVVVQHRAKILPRPIPTPETRPTTIEGWTVREVVGGMVVLEGPDGPWKATRGDTVPGVGRVDSIVRWGSRWIVATTRGLISTQ